MSYETTWISLERALAGCGDGVTRRGCEASVGHRDALDTRAKVLTGEAAPSPARSRFTEAWMDEHPEACQTSGGMPAEAGLLDGAGPESADPSRAGTPRTRRESLVPMRGTQTLRDARVCDGNFS